MYKIIAYYDEDGQNLSEVLKTCLYNYYLKYVSEYKKEDIAED